MPATLNGSGATFPNTFYKAAIDGFREQQPAITVNYGGGGSGKGRTDLQGGLVDFGGSDGLVKDENRAKFKGDFVYIPTVAGPWKVSSWSRTSPTTRSTRPPPAPTRSPPPPGCWPTPDRQGEGRGAKAGLSYLVGDGQELAADNDYAALPSSIAEKARTAITSIVVAT